MCRTDLLVHKFVAQVSLTFIWLPTWCQAFEAQKSSRSLSPLPLGLPSPVQGRRSFWHCRHCAVKVNGSGGQRGRGGVISVVWHPAHLCGDQTDSFTHLTAKDMQAQRWEACPDPTEGTEPELSHYHEQRETQSRALASLGYLLVLVMSLFTFHFFFSKERPLEGFLFLLQANGKGERVPG